MFRMLKGNQWKIASQKTLKDRLSNFEEDHEISKTPTPVKQSSSRSVPSASSASYEPSIESALKNICNKYGINSQHPASMKNTLYLNRLTEMSELVNEVGKKFNLNKEQLDRFMFEKVMGKDGQFAANLELMVRLNKLDQELGKDKNTRVSKTPQTR